MLSSNIDFVRRSLDTHLFFARIMKEHSFFLQLGFTPRDADFARQADGFRKAFDDLLWMVILLSDGVVSPRVLRSGEVVTPYTLDAERASSFYTGVDIPTELTQAEAGLSGGDSRKDNRKLEQKVFNINQKAMDLIAGLIKFKNTVLSNVLSCNMFTVNYPLLIDHILREANLYLRIIQRLQKRENIITDMEILEQELFWNRIMGEHAKFIRGLLDPTEEELFNTANGFGNLFDKLIAETRAAMNKALPAEKITDQNLKATQAIRDFKAQGTRGLLGCRIRSIIIPLLGDHTLREANHYLGLLKGFKEKI
jgi:hypothetical protein